MAQLNFVKIYKDDVTSTLSNLVFQEAMQLALSEVKIQICLLLNV